MSSIVIGEKTYNLETSYVEIFEDPNQPAEFNLYLEQSDNPPTCWIEVWSRIIIIYNNPVPDPTGLVPDPTGPVPDPAVANPTKLAKMSEVWNRAFTIAVPNKPAVRVSLALPPGSGLFRVYLARPEQPPEQRLEQPRELVENEEAQGEDELEGELVGYEEFDEAYFGQLLNQLSMSPDRLTPIPDSPILSDVFFGCPNIARCNKT